MGSNNSPLESLAAFAIVFIVGALFTAGLGAYVAKIKNHPKHAIRPH